ncbi:MAG TPA: class I SAM-dependent rRNA methyltransferase [Thermoanaerobaculia bacterium]|nr:class I SAM-dependent rRNA methyltransferase [Thermoanaerobaculia bacterium]
MIRLTLKPGREVSVLRRHPWVFSGAVAGQEGDGGDGVAEVADARGRALAYGSYSPASQIVARLWTFDGRRPEMSLFRERLAAARRLREQVLPPETTGYRAINSEGDLCPGVLCDIYGDTAVVELLTEGVEAWRADLEAAVQDAFTPARLVVRETGKSRDAGEGSQRSKVQSPESGTDNVVFMECGLSFVADIGGGQKTGFFLDQRENRRRLREVARNRTVLNLFSYSGAFSVAALAGGARRSVDVDSSEAALSFAREHRRSNGFTSDDADFVRADVFEDARRRVAAGERWDIVVCDPPAFAKKRADVERAARGYKDINRLAMSLVGPDGWLLTCSCSGLVSADLFQKIVFSASGEAGAPFLLAARQGAGPDHPVSLDCPEGEYLKGLWLRRA